MKWCLVLAGLLLGTAWGEPWGPLEHRGSSSAQLFQESSQEWKVRLAGHWTRGFPGLRQSGDPYLLEDGRLLLPVRPDDLPSSEDLWILLDRNGTERWRLPAKSLAGRGLPHVVPLNATAVVWIAADGRHALLQADDCLAAVSLDSGQVVDVAQVLAGEWNNPAADTGCLLRAAHWLKLTPPQALLRREDADAHWLQLGWLARGGDARARLRLLRGVADGHQEALEGLALLGAAAVRKPLLQAMKAGSQWYGALDLLGAEGDDILLQALRVARTDGSANNLLDKAMNKDARFWEPLVRLCASPPNTVAGYLAQEALTTVQVPDLDARLLSMVNHPQVQKYFQIHPYRPASRALLDRLKKDPSSDIVSALQFQNRVDFGLDAAAWERWLAQGVGQPAAVKAHLLAELREPTSVLWQAQLGVMDAQTLRNYPRLQAIWPVAGSLSADGRSLRGAHPNSVGPGWAFWDTAETMANWDPRSGRRQAAGFWAGDGRYLFTAEPSGWLVRDRKARRELHVTTRGRGYFCYAEESGQALFRQLQGFTVLDVEKFRLFDHDGERCAVSPTRPELASLLPGPRLQLWDWRLGRSTFEVRLDWRAEGVEFSADGEWLLLAAGGQGASWAVYDRGGRRLFGGAGQMALAPDRKGLLTDQSGVLRTVPLAHPERAVELPWPGEFRPTFWPDSQRVLLPRGERLLSLLNTADLNEEMRFWGPTQACSIDRDGRHFSGSEFEAEGKHGETWIWDMPRSVPAVPAEKQSLLCELWTGMHLRGGMAVPLTSEDYQSRLRRWREDGGGDWYTGPWDISRPDGGWGIVLGSGLAMGLLAVLWFGQRGRV